MLRTWLVRPLLAFLVAVLGGGAAAQSPDQAPATPSSATTSLEVGSATHYALEPALAVLEDPDRSLTFEQILQPAHQQQFVSLAGQGRSSNFGLTQAAIWLRVQLQVQPQAASGWQLEVAHASLDRVELYTPKAGGGFEQHVSGDHLPFSARLTPHYNHVFPLQLPPGTAQTLYLRVVSDGTLSVPLTLWQTTALDQQDHGTYALLGLYFGLLTGLVLYNLLLFLSLRETLYLEYIGFAVGMGVTQLGITGFGAEFIWPNSPGWGNISVLFSPAVSGVFALLFARTFLATRLNTPRTDRWLLALTALFGLTALGTLVLPYQIGAWMLNLEAIAFSLSVTGISLQSLWRRQPNAGYFLAAWAVLLVSILVKSLHNFGWLPSYPLVVHSLLIGSAVEMLVLAFSLADRLRTSRREAAEARGSEQVVVKALRDSERELESRVLARTEELEKANQQLQHNEYQLALQANHDTLTGLANRKLLNDRLCVSMEHAKRSQQGFAVLMLDLDGFKQVNDQYGHAAGDTVLQSVALRLTSTVRGVDTVARVGGDEFVLILDAVNSAANMMAIARKVREALGAPITLDTGENVQVGTSIGLAIYPVDGASVEQLLAAADHAMYVTKSSHRAASDTGGFSNFSAFQ
ncbi:diguanylate cyclase domain-containing protein [Rhodoferax sp.]|uniref:diguanylate cyclase domain-containing protein n=1 Tax=Rhodoferax sp. TaxID=50421 RepID=UPI00374CC55C